MQFIRTSLLLFLRFKPENSNFKNKFMMYPLTKKIEKNFFSRFFYFIGFYRVVFHSESIGDIFKRNRLSFLKQKLENKPKIVIKVVENNFFISFRL
jgi:hypothetical protein